jgi:hypothetical protein
MRLYFHSGLQVGHRIFNGCGEGGSQQLRKFWNAVQIGSFIIMGDSADTDY